MTTAARIRPDDITQEEILRAALRLYQKFGPAKVTMDDVATASGRSRTSLYYYYRNRDEIFQAVVEKIADEMAVEIRQAVAAAETLPDKIYAFCFSKIKASGDWKKVLAAMWTAMSAEEQPKHGRVMASLHSRLIYHESKILNEILADAARRKDIRAISPGDQDMLVFLISSGIRGLRREIFELDDPHDLKTALRLLTDMVVKWLRK
ncbi:MAG TPA: TetR/AcrR family transcriptional regulator [Puia sp.]|nr:TetR/AcrR family transcriptional regulator [Puia sp.]